MRLDAGLSKYLLPAPLVLLAACSLQDPSGTSWEVTFHMVSAPETLFVRSAGDNGRVDFDADSLLLFVQEMDTVRVRVGDSLSWNGSSGAFELFLGRLQLEDLGQSGAALPFVALFPEFAPLVGTATQITEQADFQVDLDLPPFEDFDWVAFHQSTFDLEVEHAFPFTLEFLNIELFNDEDQALGSDLLNNGGSGLTSGTLYEEEVDLAGLATAALRLRLSGRNSPMDEPALITNGNLDLLLAQRSGEADSARALIDSQPLALTDSLSSDDRLHILDALADSLNMSFRIVNHLDVPLDLRLGFPELFPDDGVESLEIFFDDLQEQEERNTQLPAGQLRFQPRPVEGDQHLLFQIEGATGSTPDFRTVRAGDRLEFEMELDRSRLTRFQGRFRQDQVVELEEGQREIPAFPEELGELDLQQLSVQFRLDNDLDFGCTLSLEVDVASGPGSPLPDSTLFIVSEVPAGADAVLVPGMGRLVSRLPEALTFRGFLTIAEGGDVQLFDTTAVNLLAVEIPALLQLSTAHWASLPERYDDQVPDEVELLALESTVHSTVPLGGELSAYVAVAEGEPAVTLFNLGLPAAPWIDGVPGIAVDTLRMGFGEEALGVMQNDSWIMWYEYHADATDGAVAVYADQWLALVTTISATTTLEVD